MKNLFLLLVLIGSVVHLGARETESFTQTYPLTATGTVKLENVNGSVEIIGWDQPSVKLEAVKTAPSKEDLEHIHLRIDAEPDRLSVKTEYDRKAFLRSWQGEVRYTLHVPAKASLERISAVNAGLHIRDVLGPLTLKTVNGPIEASGLTGPGSFETVNGSMKVQYASLAGIDELSLRTVNGGCTLILPKSTAFTVNSSTVNGNVRAEGELKIEKTSRGHFRATSGSGGPAISFHSVNGDLRIRE